VENVTTFGKKFLNQPIEPDRRHERSGNRYTRSHVAPVEKTENRKGIRIKEGRRASQEEQNSLQSGSEFGSAVVTTNDVKCQPSYGGLSGHGFNRMMLPSGNPGGAGELRPHLVDFGFWLLKIRTKWWRIHRLDQLRSVVLD